MVLASDSLYLTLILTLLLVYLGFTGWSAGSFDSKHGQTTSQYSSANISNTASYTLSLTPVDNGGTWSDNGLVTGALIPNF